MAQNQNQNQNSATTSVLEALKEHRTVTVTGGGSSTRPTTTHTTIDLTAAVVSISVNHQQRKAEMLVGDHSLERHQCARILFWRLSSVDLDKCKSIQKGDIVRLNCVTVRKDYTTNTNTNHNYNHEQSQAKSKSKNMEDTKSGAAINKGHANAAPAPLAEKLSTILCDFSHSFQTPATGSTFGKIASMNPMVHGGYYVMASPEADLCRSLNTPRETVHAVGEWFLENHHMRSMGISSYNQDHEEHRHQKRKVRELTASNMLSDVLVRTSQLGVDDTTMNTLGNRKKQQPSITLFRAILMDGDGIENENDTIPFHVESCNPLLNRLRQLSRTRDIFLIRQVLTVRNDASRRPHRGTSNGNGGGANMEIILVPTANTSIDSTMSVSVSTTASALASNKRLRLTSTCSYSEDQHEQLHPSISESESPTSISLGDQQQSISFLRSLPISSSNVERLPPVMSSLSCIHYEGEHLHLKAETKTSSWPTCSTLSYILTQRDESNGIVHYYYKPAILTLCVSNGGTDTDSSSAELCVKANGNIMEILCGSYEPSRLAPHTHGDGMAMTIQKVSDLLRGLVHLRVPLKWTLVRKYERGTSFVHVEDVALPSLDFF